MRQTLKSQLGWWLVLMMIGVLPHTVSSQTSDVQRDRTGGLCSAETIMDRYRPIGSDCSMIRDTVTRLEWQRCSMGQTWDATTQRCGGKPEFLTWEQAVTQTAAGDFRLPTLEELRSLVYCSNTGTIAIDANRRFCSGATLSENHQQPTIVQPAFPETPVWGFWATNNLDPHSAWYVFFSHGDVSYSGETGQGHVRLVRSGRR